MQHRTLTLLVLAVGCTGAGDGSDALSEDVGPDPAVELDGSSVEARPVVHSNPTFTDDIEVTTHVYGQGQVHVDWMGPVDRSSNQDEVTDGLIELKLDVYEPTTAPGGRPALMFIHGGGFHGGTRDKTDCVTFANYFAARGFVAVSISYRLAKHRGTVRRLGSMSLMASTSVTTAGKKGSPSTQQRGTRRRPFGGCTRTPATLGLTPTLSPPPAAPPARS